MLPTVDNKEGFIDSVLLTSVPDNLGSIVRSMKPGSHLLLLNEVKQHHLGTIEAEDNGLEIRDTIAYVFADSENDVGMVLVTVARKPLDGTVADNVVKWGVGGLDIDGCRVGADGTDLYFNRSLFQGRYEKKGLTSYGGEADWKHGDNSMPNSAGRWPANLIHDGSCLSLALFPKVNKQAKCKTDDKSGWQSKYVGGSVSKPITRTLHLDDDNGGSAARFFYSAPSIDNLVAYLLKLVTPENGTVFTNCNTDGMPKEYNYV